MSLLHGLGGGSPFFIKLFLQHLWQRWRLKEPPLPVGGDMIRELLQEACDDRQAKGVLENIYERHLYPPERALLILFADRQAEMQDVAESPEVRRQELDLLGSEYLSAARSLESRGYLEGETDAGYRLRFGYLGHWLRNWYRYDVERDRLQVARLSEKLQTEVRVNRERDEVFVKGHRAKLSPMEMKAIVCLASAAPSVVSRDQLADALWPEAQGGVTDNQIDQVIRRLRLALGETAEPWRYVKRMGGGYRVERTALVDS
jgi:hypothetical protein